MQSSEKLELAELGTCSYGNEGKQGS